MTPGPKVTPTCIGCSRPKEESEGMVGIHHGGMPTWLCWGCIDGLKLIVDAARRDAAKVKPMRLAVVSSDRYPEDAR